MHSLFLIIKIIQTIFESKILFFFRFRLELNTPIIKQQLLVCVIFRDFFLPLRLKSSIPIADEFQTDTHEFALYCTNQPKRCSQLYDVAAYDHRVFVCISRERNTVTRFYVLLVSIYARYENLHIYICNDTNVFFE